MEKEKIKQIFESQKKFFLTDQTQNIEFRTSQLKQLKKYIIIYEKEILNALDADLHKPEFEAWIGEIQPVLHDIDEAIKRLHYWIKPHTVKTPWALFPATSYIHPQPYGISLVMAPWNFPFQLCFLPLIGSLAAGNTIIIKPSEFAPHTADIMEKIISDTFPSEYITVIQGEILEAQALLELPFNYIFFTGSTRVGKIVMKKAAEHVIPLTLELGGKNPCIVDESTNLDVATRRIIWGKFFNAGQNCIAPDYLLIKRSIKEKFISLAKKYITQFYGANPKRSSDFARIVNDEHMDRLTELLQEGSIVCGGEVDFQEKYIAPTIIDNLSKENAVFHEEIFGPILPIFIYDSFDEIIEIIQNKPKSLVIYYFGSNKEERKRLKYTRSGSLVFNDVLIQGSNHNLPFGGIGWSGFGKYYSKKSFERFSHYRSILKNRTFPDFSLRYPPYDSLKKVRRWLISFFG